MKKLLLLATVAFMASCQTSDLCEHDMNPGECIYEGAQVGALSSYLDIYIEDLIRYNSQYGNQVRDWIYAPQNTIKFNLGGTLPLLTNAVALGSCNDNLVQIHISRSHWAGLQPSERLWLMYHELGHDIHNIQHSTGIMANGNLPIDGKTAERFIEARDEHFAKLVAYTYETYSASDCADIRERVAELLNN